MDPASGIFEGRYPSAFLIPSCSLPAGFSMHALVSSSYKQSPLHHFQTCFGSAPGGHFEHADALGASFPQETSPFTITTARAAIACFINIVSTTKSDMHAQ